MKRFKAPLYYIAIAGICFLAMRLLIILAGNKGSEVVERTDSAWNQFSDSFLHALYHPLATLLLQIITILFAARLLGFLFNKIRQPAVIGEIVAGILLGPTLLGQYFPEISQFLFPENSISNLQFISQIGLILFMFTIGMELDFGMLKGKAKSALLISHTGIWLSFTLGILLAYFMYDIYAPANAPFLSFALFIGISMSITAFPVLARVVKERGLMRTHLGGLAMTSAAIDDISAWCLLAIVVAIVKAGTAAGAMYNILFTLTYVLIMLVLVRPFMKRVGEIYNRKKLMSRWIIAISFLVLLISSYIADLLGIHALFGAFMAGIVMPPSLNFRRILSDKTEDVALIIFLPLFFVYSGLRTKLGLLDTKEMWFHALIVVAFAVSGKFFGAFIGSRFTRQSFKDSLQMGALMNTRGLMELVVLNIGLDLGVLSPEIFSMLVVMALLTTFMTGPLMELILFIYRKDEVEKVVSTTKKKYKVLVSFANPQKAPKLLRISQMFAGNSDQGLVTVLHLSNADEVNTFEASQLENEVFAPIHKAAKEQKMKVQTVHRFTHEFSRDVLGFAKRGKYDILLMGAGKSIFQGSILGNIMGLTVNALNPEKVIGTIIGKDSILPETKILDDKTRYFLETSKCSVGIFVDRGFETPRQLMVYISSTADLFLMKYARLFQQNTQATIIVCDPYQLCDRDIFINQNTDEVQLIFSDLNIEFKEEFFKGFDLLISSHNGWKEKTDGKKTTSLYIPSAIIIKP